MRWSDLPCLIGPVTFGLYMGAQVTSVDPILWQNESMGFYSNYLYGTPQSVTEELITLDEK